MQIFSFKIWVRLYFANICILFLWQDVSEVFVRCVFSVLLITFTCSIWLSFDILIKLKLLELGGLKQLYPSPFYIIVFVWNYLANCFSYLANTISKIAIGLSHLANCISKMAYCFGNLAKELGMNANCLGKLVGGFGLMIWLIC